MQDKPNKLLSDQDIFDLFERARKEYERYLEINSFNEFSMFGVQEKRFQQLNETWDKPLDLCLFKEKKNAIME